MTVKTIIEKYGEPGAVKNLTTLYTPYPLVIAWDKSKTVNRFQIHKLAAPSMTKIMNELLTTYGLGEINRLGINLFGGAYNNRPMRGTEERYNALIKAGRKEDAYQFLSTHAWGLAIDIDPEKNPLKATSKTATFAKPEYKAMIDIFYKHGWYSLGREKGFDFMHYQFIKP
jgi:hypothetical protein